VKKLLRKLPLLLILAAVLGGLVYGFRPVPAAVEVAEVKRGRLRMTVEKEGKTRIKQRYVVSAPLAGRMQRVTLKPGDYLQQQTPLAVIEPVNPTLLDTRARAETRARVQGAQAALMRAHVKLKRARVAKGYAEKEHERLRRLGSGAASQQELENAALKEGTTGEEMHEAEFGVQVAEFELAQAEAALSFLEPPPGVLSSFFMGAAHQPDRKFPIPSPIPRGKVLKVLKESSAVVTPGTEIMEVGDPESLEAEVDLLTPDAVKVRPQMLVLLEHWGGDAPLEGRVRLVEPAGFTKTSALGVEEQRVNVIIDFQLPRDYRGAVGDAFRVEARIIIWEGKNVLKIPAGALFRHGDGWAVYVMADDKAALRPVKMGHNNGLEAEILGGLDEGERVVVHPGDKIKDGVAIAPR
jgi:HlyD family secretion protein